MYSPIIQYMIQRDQLMICFFKKEKDQFETEAVMYMNIHTTWNKNI